ncbi:VWA domain-containing protein [Thioalkalivibrio sp. ALMg9]|uniref:VWA domain-containing protein n=1 Tax=Thioalkalivibrio sp. ALMg9 TaxID=1266912 RepID=UPI000365A3FB|nr:VWA domain-containing protein [Thioalkalivibrio sp. ALMg9]
MTLEYGKSRLLVPALLAASIGLSGCGGGGGGDGGGGGTTPSAGITVVPERFDFGIITEGNEDHVLPRQFIIRNEGTTSSNIADISLRRDDFGAFSVDTSGGSNPCGAPPFDLAGGGSCTVEVEFDPRRFDTYEALLIAQSDDPNTPTVGSTLAGTYERIKSINVTVNQINACPRPDEPHQAFVSVTDQAGWPISDVQSFGGFTLEGLDLIGVRQVGGTSTDTDLSLSIAMDYSGSITDFPDAVDNMEAGAKSLVDAMKDNDKDKADIIKYALDVKPMTLSGFTSDKDVLETAIDKDPGDIGRDTAFYYATEIAIDRFETEGGTNDRKAVIALTDGEDTTVPVDERDLALDDAIAQALGEDIPVFTIGFGQYLQKDELQQLAVETGGLFYELASDANLQQVFVQVALLLFKDQYVIDFGGLSGNEESSFEVAVKYEKYGEVFVADGDKTIQACSGP